MKTINIKANDILIVPPDTYSPKAYSGINGARVIGEFVGKVLINGDGISNSNDSVFRINDGNTGMMFDGMVFQGMWRGTWITMCDSVDFTNCLWEGNAQEGFISGGCNFLTLQDVVSKGNGPGPNRPSKPAGGGHPEKSADHAFYLSYGTSHSLMNRFLAELCTGCGIHTNRNADRGIHADNLIIMNGQILGCGSEGTPAVQLDGTDNSEMHNVLIANSPIGAFTFFDDGSNSPTWACHNWDLGFLTVYNPNSEWNIHIVKGTTGLHFHDSIFVIKDSEPLFDAIDNGNIEDPTFTNNIICTDHKGNLPAQVVSNNTIYPTSKVSEIFVDAANGNFTIKDTGITQGYCKEGRAASSSAPLTYKDCPSCIGRGYPAGKVPA